MSPFWHGLRTVPPDRPQVSRKPCSRRMARRPAVGGSGTVGDRATTRGWVGGSCAVGDTGTPPRSSTTSYFEITAIACLSPLLTLPRISGGDDRFLRRRRREPPYPASGPFLGPLVR